MKKIAALAAILAALFGWAVWSAMAPKSAGQQMPAYAAVDRTRVDMIRIDVPGQPPLELKRVEGGWKLDGRGDADAEAVDRLLGDLAAMRPVRLVTSHADRHAALGVGASSTQLVLAGADGGELLRLHVGKQGTELISTYVRYGDHDEVVAVDRTLLWQVRRAPEAWLAGAQAAGDGKGAAE